VSGDCIRGGRGTHCDTRDMCTEGRPLETTAGSHCEPWEGSLRREQASPGHSATAAGRPTVSRVCNDLLPVLHSAAHPACV
jgi:hypothetical protein